jgi:lipopolysaccharide/colanic/teichoic acid biosynthesis glycosyltransferase
VRDAFIHALTELAPQHPELLLLTGDLGFKVLDRYRASFPRQFLNVGVAEQNMAGLAAGLALEGHTVFTYSIGNFPTLRCLEQIRNDICYHGANVKIVCIGGGMSYGPVGFSHHATEDLAILRSLPNMLVLSPGDLWEATEASRYLVSHRGPAYLRLDKSYAPATAKPGDAFRPGSIRTVRDGKDVTLAATGGILGEALLAADILADQGIFLSRAERSHYQTHRHRYPRGRRFRDRRHRQHRGTRRRRRAGRRDRGSSHGSGRIPSILSAHGASQYFLVGCREPAIPSQVLLTGCGGNSPGRLREAPRRRCCVCMILKRGFDILGASVGMLLCSPLLVAVMLAIWLQDRRSPFYIAPRAARGSGTFRMVKFRSMVVDADKIGGSSTAATDRRITPIGQFVRAYKLDELIQLWNVLKGDMSFVGPRPQVLTDAGLYTDAEQRMLTVRPGITDPASIVFSDEGEILKGSTDPDLLYNQIIRPWKSRLALLYIDNRSFLFDTWLILLTAVAIASRRTALQAIQRLLQRWGADPLVLRMACREDPLLPYPPPGATEVVAQYQ